MNSDTVNEKYSLKQILFQRAIPPYVINVPTNDHKVFGCIDCGDRFILESSYENHINRKSLKISYTCRRCNGNLQRKIFYNRCNFLSHIRSHSFKTASINVSDLQIEPLPIGLYTYHSKISEVPETRLQCQQQIIQTRAPENNAENLRSTCPECNVDIAGEGPANKDRVAHYMKYCNKFLSCPVCLLALPTICAIKSHLRVHLKIPPYFCPECGIHLSSKVIRYPFNHSCEGFNMIRATTRVACTIPNCQTTLFHPQDYKNHIKLDHMKKVFKCPYCDVACLSAVTINKHYDTHEQSKSSNKKNIIIFYKCESCPGRLVLHSHLENHVNTHLSYNAFPCWTCGSRFKTVRLLIAHHFNSHITLNNIVMMKELKNVFGNALALQHETKNPNKKIFRVVKRCEQCLRSFSYKCLYDDINGLPNVCPYKCTPGSKSLLKNDSTSANIKCPLCKHQIDQKWETVKKHFASDHKDYKCLDCKVTTNKLDVKIRNNGKIRKKNSVTKTRRIRKRKGIANNKSADVNVLRSDLTGSKNALGDIKTGSKSLHICVKCKHECQSKEDLEKHVRDHRDPYMAYQCMECLESFAVKPSFSTHLLIKHEISNVDDYIEKKQCYNADALFKCQETNKDDLPLEENQCKICRDKFGDSEELEKHFRVHGMAFLMKNAQSKATPCNLEFKD